MSGLEVVDDKTFNVTLSAPFAQFPVTVGYNAFYPLPESFFEDPEAAGKHPVGNGPFKADEEFVPGQGITLTRYDDYAGDEQAKADTVEFRSTPTSTRPTPTSRAATSTSSTTSRRTPSPRRGRVRRPLHRDGRRRRSPTSASRPTTRASRTSGSVRPSRWRSTARRSPTPSSRAPASRPTSVIAPVVDGHREDACKYCEVDAEAANELLDEAGFDKSQPVELWFNAGAGHDAWVEAVGNQLRENLGIEFNLKGDLDFAEYLPLLDEKGVTGPFRLGWSMDYPSPQNYLEPLYSTAALPPAGSNSAFYCNPEFDDLVAQGNEAATNEEAIELYTRRRTSSWRTCRSCRCSSGWSRPSGRRTSTTSRSTSSVASTSPR